MHFTIVPICSLLLFGRNITEIEDNAFYGCTSLRFITLGDCVETIGSYAFYGGNPNKYYENSDCMCYIACKH
ncbi:MAG: leucine-rich repeat protein [Alistipes onderdonkii]